MVYIWSFTSIHIMVLCAFVSERRSDVFCLLSAIASLIQLILWNVGFWICHSWSWALLGYSSLFFGFCFAFMLFLMVMDQW